MTNADAVTLLDNIIEEIEKVRAKMIINLQEPYIMNYDLKEWNDELFEIIWWLKIDLLPVFLYDDED